LFLIFKTVFALHVVKNKIPVVEYKQLLSVWYGVSIVSTSLKTRFALTNIRASTSKLSVIGLMCSSNLSDRGLWLP
jgi:hypothetical protein